MWSETLRIPRLLIIVGYLAIVVGYGVDIAVYSNLLDYRLVTEIAFPVSYGLIGAAWWQWTSLERTNTHAIKVMKRASRTMAAASAVIAIGNVANAYDTVHLHGQVQRVFPHYRLIVGGALSLAAGFLLCAIGFATASTLFRVMSIPPEDVAKVDVGS